MLQWRHLHAKLPDSSSGQRRQTRPRSRWRRVGVSGPPPLTGRNNWKSRASRTRSGVAVWVTTVSAADNAAQGRDLHREHSVPALSAKSLYTTTMTKSISWWEEAQNKRTRKINLAIAEAPVRRKPFASSQNCCSYPPAVCLGVHANT